MEQKQIINHLISTNQFFIFTPMGELVTMEELLTKEWGRPVTYDEAIAYMRKQQFINRIKQHAHEPKNN